MSKQYNGSDIGAFKNVWVFCEQRGGKMMPTTFELGSEGRKLANELGVELGGILTGDSVASIAKELDGYSADKVYVYDHPLRRPAAHRFVRRLHAPGCRFGRVHRLPARQLLPGCGLRELQTPGVRRLGEPQDDPPRLWRIPDGHHCPPPGSVRRWPPCGRAL